MRTLKKEKKKIIQKDYCYPLNDIEAELKKIRNLPPEEFAKRKIIAIPGLTEALHRKWFKVESVTDDSETGGLLINLTNAFDLNGFFTSYNGIPLRIDPKSKVFKIHTKKKEKERKEILAQENKKKNLKKRKIFFKFLTILTPFVLIAYGFFKLWPDF